MSTTLEMLKKVFTQQLKNINTAIPGHVVAFSPETQLAQLQIGIQFADVNGGTHTHAPIIECPVGIYGGSVGMIEIEINPGDEGLIIFSQRCIDGWVTNGGVANNPIARFHDAQDAFFIPGFRSQPNSLGNYENNGIRMRNNSGSNSIWLKNDGNIEINANNVTFNVSSNVEINAFHLQTNADSSFFDTNFLRHNTVNIGATHLHSGVESGTDLSGVPQ